MRACHLLPLKVKKQSEETPTKPSEVIFPNDWMETGTCLAASCELEVHVCGTGHCFESLAEKQYQLARLFGRLSIRVY